MKMKQPNNNINYFQCQGISPGINFISSEEILYCIRREGKLKFPIAYSLIKNGTDLAKKYNLIANYNQNLIKASPLVLSDWKSYDISSDTEKNLLINGNLNISGGFKKDLLGIFKMNIQVKSETSLDKNTQDHVKTFKKIISAIVRRAEIRIPINAIQINPVIERKIEKILFGPENEVLSKEEKYIEMCEYLQDYGQVIPTAVTIGAKYSFLLESEDKKKLDNFRIDTDNNIEFNDSNDFKKISKDNPIGNNNYSDDKNFKLQIKALYDVKNNSNISDVKVNIFNIGSPLSDPTYKEWEKTLDKKCYEIIDVEESYDILKFVNPELKDKAEDLFKDLNHNKVNKIKTKKKIKDLIDSGFSPEPIGILGEGALPSIVLKTIKSKEHISEACCKYGICDNKSKWIFGATPKVLKNLGIPFDTQTYNIRCEIEPIPTALKYLDVIGFLLNSDENDPTHEAKEILEEFPGKMVIGYKITSTKSKCKCAWSRGEEDNIENSQFYLYFELVLGCKSEFSVEVYLVDKI